MALGLTGGPYVALTLFRRSACSTKGSQDGIAMMLANRRRGALFAEVLWGLVAVMRLWTHRPPISLTEALGAAQTPRL